MGRKKQTLVEDKGRVASIDRRRQRHDCIDARHYSSLVSPQQQQEGPKNKEKLIECLCSCCLLCACCPLCCFIKPPCRICHQALRRAWQWACYGSTKNRVFAAEYSSFSDIDSDVTYGKHKRA